MITCLVSVIHQDRQWDLELPGELACRQLKPMLQQALQLPSEGCQHLLLKPLGVALADDQTLVGAEVLDGSILELSASASRPESLVVDSPAGNWRPLTSPSSPSPAPAPEKPAEAGYQWKKLDD